MLGTQRSLGVPASDSFGSVTGVVLLLHRRVILPSVFYTVLLCILDAPALQFCQHETAFQFLYILSHTCLLFVRVCWLVSLLGGSHAMCVRCYFLVVLSPISVTIRDADYLFMCLVAIYVPSWEKRPWKSFAPL